LAFTYESTWRQNPEHHPHENLISHTNLFFLEEEYQNIHVHFEGHLSTYNAMLCEDELCILTHLKEITG
jgi:hypothetical protein